MNLYAVYRPDRADYDEYDSFVCAAESEDDARKIHPDPIADEGSHCAWTADRASLTVTLLGVAMPGTMRGVILASFNAG